MCHYQFKQNPCHNLKIAINMNRQQNSLVNREAILFVSGLHLV